ncbi:coiled-coil domain-containing protein 97 [Lingula anatina]|uniref:Coiled-coil domain-containing protein 97 n=1 Tax=Lingula anatina TaxID=7574 RepID=A0A1S3IHD1_LINAN|nr:coiled-coil domain-containing protein 97 [Lingula anatina]XP_013397533.1 coiled-coil domain-containing protein 97 [Lingula anatina]|eukprot:XP_013397532.1 coiled-coil domain-containing protein 97 [Lingula anatina]
MAKSICSLMETNNTTVDDMCNRLGTTNAHFKHQQRGEPDLTVSQKADIAREIYAKNPATFLSRFGKYMLEEDVSHFENFKGNYEVDFHLKELRKQFSKKESKTIIKNRRYEAMKKLIEDGEYFSEEEMKSRNPLLYEQMIGQYLTEEEIQEKAGTFDRADCRFSHILMDHVGIVLQNELYYKQKEIENDQCEESEEEEEDECEEELEMDNGQSKDGRENLPEAERNLLKEEFLNIMKERFMNGEDEDFDYSKVDTNAEYDSLDIREHDEEEKYFDEEEPDDLLIESHDDMETV